MENSDDPKHKDTKIRRRVKRSHNRINQLRDILHEHKYTKVNEGQFVEYKIQPKREDSRDADNSHLYYNNVMLNINR